MMENPGNRVLDRDEHEEKRREARHATEKANRLISAGKYYGHRKQPWQLIKLELK